MSDAPFTDASDPDESFAESEQIVTNDAVAGETVEPGIGEEIGRAHV